MTKNPLTFRHIADGVALPASPAPVADQRQRPPTPRCTTPARCGRSMLWECYSNLLNDTGRLAFAQAQERMKRYLVGGYKMTPANPTFVERARRDAVGDAGAGSARPRSLPAGLREARRRRRRRGAERAVTRTTPASVESFRRCCRASGTRRPVIEYYHAAFDHYFVTDIPTRSPSSTTARSRAGREPANRSTCTPTRRRAAPPCAGSSARRSAPRSSHFYTSDAARVRARSRQNPDWQFEGVVFGVLARRTRRALPGGNAAGLPGVQQRTGRRAEPSLHDQHRDARGDAREGLDRRRLRGARRVMCSPA